MVAVIAPQSEGDALDGYFDQLMMGVNGNECASQNIARGLNDGGRYRIWELEHTGAVEIHIAETIGRLVVEDRRMPEEEKWGMQRWFYDRSVLWSRTVGIMRKLDQDTLGKVSRSGFLSDTYVVPPLQHYMGRVSGMVKRWAGSHAASQNELEYGLQLLSSGVPGVTLSISNLADGQAGRVRVTFADQA